MDSRKLRTQQNYSEIADLYTSDFGNDHECFDSFIAPVISHVEKRNFTSPIVDLGTGPGNVIDFMLSKGARNKIIGVDFTESFCYNLRVKFQDSKQVEIVCGDMLHFVVNQVDVSISAYTACYSIIHIPDEEIDSLFENIQRTLVHKGLFAFSVWKGNKKDMEPEPYQTQHDPRLIVNEKLESYLNSFTEEELINRLSKAKLNVLEMNTILPNLLPGEYSQSKIWTLAQKG